MNNQLFIVFQLDGVASNGLSINDQFIAVSMTITKMTTEPSMSLFLFLHRQESNMKLALTSASGKSNVTQKLLLVILIGIGNPRINEENAQPESNKKPLKDIKN